MEVQLKTMVEYALNVCNVYTDIEDPSLHNTECLRSIINYAEFLSQKPELWMFVPCDKEGNVLKGKPLCPATDEEWERWEKEEPIFKKAKSKVIFEGFNVYKIPDGSGSFTVKSDSFQICHYKAKPDYFVWANARRIEDIAEYDIEVTQSKAKELGLI